MKTDFLTRQLSLALGFGLVMGTIGSAQAQTQATFTPANGPNVNVSTSVTVNTTDGVSQTGPKLTFTSETHYNPWALNVLKKLEIERLDAVMVEGQGHFMASLDKWEMAIRNLLDTAQYPENHYTLMYQVAERTLEIAQSLKVSAAAEARSCPDNDKACIKRFYEPIFVLYDHSYQQIKKYHDFDERLYARAMNSFYGNKGVSPAANSQIEFANELRDYALEQISWFKSEFVVRTGQDEIGPKYSTKTAYAVMNAVVKGLIFDLGGDAANPNPNRPIFATAFAEPAALLSGLSERLTQQLSGNTYCGNESESFWYYNWLLDQANLSLKSRAVK